VERGPSVARRTAQALADAAWPDVDDAAPPPDEEAPAADSDDLDGAGVDTDATDAPEQLLRDDDPDAPPASYPLAARAAHAGAAAARLGRALRALGGRLREAYGRLRSPHSAEDGEVAPSPSPLLRIAHASGRISASLHQLFQRSAQPTKRRTTGAPARVVRAQSPKAQSKPTAEAKRPRNQRLYAAAFAIVGVGIGVYALAPRSGADRIRAGRFAAPVSAPEPVPMVTPIQVPASTATPAPEPMAAPTAVQGVTVPAAAAPAEPSAAEQPPAAPFGEPIIENGRTFVLRMSGPVRHIEGEARDDGFTVRVPGRLALDRAQPIANAHQAVARAMVLNRGEYAELTVDFRPGMRPKYQVVGKDNALEITLARP
jgi:hypothetical protein